MKITLFYRVIQNDALKWIKITSSNFNLYTRKDVHFVSFLPLQGVHIMQNTKFKKGEFDVEPTVNHSLQLLKSR